MGLSMMGPLASSISKGMPSAGSGVRMSLQCHNIDVLCSVFGTPRSSWRVVCTTQQRVCYDKGRLVGVPRHLNRMTPSGLKDSQGCKLISQMRSVVSDRSRNDGWRLARSLYACRPAKMSRSLAGLVRYGQVSDKHGCR